MLLLYRMMMFVTTLGLLDCNYKMFQVLLSGHPLETRTQEGVVASQQPRVFG